MNNHALLFSGAESRKNYNIAIAKEALLFARSIIPIDGSCTHPAITDRALINKLYKQIKQNRKQIPTLWESLYYLLVKWDDFEKISLKKRTRSSKLSHVENCGVLSGFAAIFLKKKNVASIEIIGIEKSDHAFLIIDRTQTIGSDINNVNTWGDTCIILDVLNNEIYDGSELYQKLKCYHFNKRNDNPHVLTPFLETNKLKVTQSLTCFIDPIKNKEMLDKFLRKVAIFYDVLQDFSESDDIKQLMQKIKCYESEDYDLDNNTNFAMERLLDKKIRVILKEIDTIPLINKEELYLDVIVNISGLYTTAFQYFRDLVNLEMPFLHFMSHVREFEGGNVDKLKTALSTKDNLNYLLSFAMLNTKALSAEVLMDHGADPTTKDNNGDSVLIWAIKKKRINIIAFLLNYYDHLFTTRDEDGFLPIHEVAFQGFYKAVSLILNKFPHLINSPLDSGKTPLHLVVREGHFKTFMELLKFGADQSIPDQKGTLPIHLAAMNGRIEMIQVLLDNNPILINYRDPIKLKTALHLAAEKGHIRIVEELLHRGADAGLADSAGSLPIHLAANAGHADIVKMIMDGTVVAQSEEQNTANVKEKEENVLQTEKDRKIEREKPSLQEPTFKKTRF